MNERCAVHPHLEFVFISLKSIKERHLGSMWLLGCKYFNRLNLSNVQLSHLIGCIDINAIFDMVQGLVQVARTGRSEKTVASICLQA